jgi:hypothetical protein
MRFGSFISCTLLLAASLAVATPAHAVIEALTPLKLFIDDSRLILAAKVEKLDASRQVAVLAVLADLKGEADFRRLPLKLSGDTADQAAQLLERLAPDLSVILFIDEHKLVFGYSNGTWFQAKLADDRADARGAFTHFEPSLRRTFCGSTAELQTILSDVIAGKRKPPPVNPKEKPGLGPTVEAAAKP